MIVWLLACGSVENTKPTPLADVATTFEKVAQDPSQTVELCKMLTPTTQRDQCYLIGAENLQRKQPEKVADICPLILSEVQGECWFRLAERTSDPNHCDLSTPYELDCRLHLLSRQLFRSKSDEWSTLIDTAHKYSIDPNSVEGKTVLFRHWLSINDSIQPTRCTKTLDESSCLLAAQGLYRDRLRYSVHTQSFPCTADLPVSIQHNDAPVLKNIYTEFHRVHCVD